MMSVLSHDTLSWIGQTVTGKPHQVTRTDVARFAIAIGAHDPAHFDEQHARRLGHPDVVAPLGYYVAIRLSSLNRVPLGDLGADGVSGQGIPPSNATRVMAGDTKVTFRRRIYAGDEITLHLTISDIAEKAGRSGPLALVTYSLAYLDQNQSLVVAETYTRILR